MGIVKDRRGMDLTEAEEVKESWQENSTVPKKSLNNLDNHGGTITHLARHPGM